MVVDHIPILVLTLLLNMAMQEFSTRIYVQIVNSMAKPQVSDFQVGQIVAISQANLIINHLWFQRMFADFILKSQVIGFRLHLFSMNFVAEPHEVANLQFKPRSLHFSLTNSLLIICLSLTLHIFCLRFSLLIIGLSY